MKALRILCSRAFWRYFRRYWLDRLGRLGDRDA